MAEFTTEYIYLRCKNINPDTTIEAWSDGVIVFLGDMSDMPNGLFYEREVMDFRIDEDDDVLTVYF